MPLSRLPLRLPMLLAAGLILVSPLLNGCSKKEKEGFLPRGSSGPVSSKGTSGGESGGVKAGEVTTDAEGRRFEELEFLSDGVTIKGTLVLPARTDPAPVVVLVPMLGQTRSSWDEIQLLFADEGIATLAIDLRGHGASEGGPDGYKDFKEMEWQAALADVQNAVSSLEDLPEVNAERIGLVGASIGANYALIAAAQRPGTPVIALSAGANYKGVDPTGEMSKLRRLALYVAAEGDKPAKDLLEWVEENSPDSLTWPEDGGAHGTEILPNGPLEAHMLLYFRDRWGIQPGEPGSQVSEADVETPPLTDESDFSPSDTEVDPDAPPTEEDFEDPPADEEVPEEEPAEDPPADDGDGEEPSEDPGDEEPAEDPDTDPADEG